MPTTPTNTCTAVSAGYVRPVCELGAGGVAGLWISQSTGHTFVFDSENQITSITGGTSWFKFDQVLETADASLDQIKSNLQNTSLYYESNITMVIPKKSVAIRNQVKALASSGCNIITLDNNGIYHLTGYANKCYCLEGGNNTGKALGDANNWTLKFVSKEGQPSFILSGSGAFTSSY